MESRRELGWLIDTCEVNNWAGIAEGLKQERRDWEGYGESASVWPREWWFFGWEGTPASKVVFVVEPKIQGITEIQTYSFKSNRKGRLIT